MTPCETRPSYRRSGRSCFIIPAVYVFATIAASLESAAQSLNFVQNANSQHDYARHNTLPSGFGSGEFTLEIWLRLDDSFPVGPAGGGANQLINWSSSDPQPLSSGTWWYTGNFLLDGHNNNSFADGTFSLQIVGGGRLRWNFGDGTPLVGGHWAVQEWPSADTPSLLDGNWHYVACVRRWVGGSEENSANLELWIDGGLVDTRTTNVRTNMRTEYWNDWTGFPSGQQGWFWGAEKQAAILANGVTQYEDYKGLIDDLRFWNRAKTSEELRFDWDVAVTGDEPGLVGWYTFSEGSGTTICNEISGTNCMTLFRTTAGTWSSENAPTDSSIPPDPDYVYADFNAATAGNGAQATPFNTLASAVAYANDSATIEIAPGTTSEPIVISKAVTLINGNPAGGPVVVSSFTRASGSLGQASIGFIAPPLR